MMLKAAAPLKPRLARDHFTLFTVIFALAVLAVSHAAGQWSMAVYALSFWHYVVYALAFFWRQIPLKRFKYDAALLKSMSLTAFGIVFLSSGPNLLPGPWTFAGCARIAVIAGSASQFFQGQPGEMGLSNSEASLCGCVGPMIADSMTKGRGAT